MELKVNFFSPLGYIAEAESAKQRLQEEKEVGCFLKPSLKHYRKSLRANVGIYRESQIISEKSNFGLYHPNNPLVWFGWYKPKFDFSELIWDSRYIPTLALK